VAQIEAGTLVDTNVLLDLVTNDPHWADWSLARLDEAGLSGPVFANDVVYAELSIGFTTIEATDAMFQRSGISIAPLPRAALFLAGKVFAQYRARGGVRTGVLPDFFIGAHAAVTGMRVLTRDPRRYATYFPKIVLVTPLKS